MQVEQVARQRFESFKMGMSHNASPVEMKHRHNRSHSRNASISSIASLPTPKSMTTHDVSATHSLPPAPKRNSHHRRISSVSTRRESAEMMGVTVPETSASASEDSAERDSIRRNALWALEGKRDASFAKVEIPELSAPYEFPTKPSFPPGPGTFTTSSKRDSFKPSSSKDALGTLMEEEEEEEDSDKPRAPPTPTTPTTSFTRNLGQRSRAPHLRPLSLTPDTLPSQFLASQALPTPSSPKRASLKALSLAPDASNRAGSVPSPTPARPRPVLNIKLEAASPSHDDTSMSIRQQPVRKSSISYKTSSTSSSVSSTGLPTPESTPTCTERRFSGYTHSSISSRSSQGSQGSMASNRLSVAEDDFLTMNSGNGRPLSVSEQHFLFKSHNALLARITDLERALSFRGNSNSRPSSIASSASALSSTSSRSSETGEPIDEMLCLVSDLKAERDELKRDVEGWRVRVGDMEKQLTVMGNRVEAERRDAWVARTRVGLLEVERSGLEKVVVDLQTENTRLAKSEQTLQEQVARLLREKEAVSAELQQVRSRIPRELDPLDTPRAFDGPVVHVRPAPSSMHRGLGFASSAGEDAPSTLGLGFKLRVDQEEEASDEESDELAGYEDEDENDVLISPSSSFGSVDDFRGSAASAPVVSPPSAPVPAPAHSAQKSISKWTFPKHVVPTSRDEPDIDRFFGCLEDLDSPASPLTGEYFDYDEEKSKSFFAKGFSCDDSNSCFVLPASVLATVDSRYVLDVVEEEEEELREDDESETEEETVVEDGEVNGGIKITFTPPMEDKHLEPALTEPVLPPPKLVTVPSLRFFEDEDDCDDEAPFNFGRSQPMTPERSESRPSLPSSIPRPKPSLFSPSRVGHENNSAFVTPPTKRGGTTPSFIPLPSSPSPTFSANASTTTFIRQPSRQPTLRMHQTGPANADNLSSRPSPSPEMMPEFCSPLPVSPSLSSMLSSPLGGRLSLSTFTNYIPSWGLTSPNTSPALQDARPSGSPAGTVKRGYVSKQSQLDRLKSRMEFEAKTASLRRGDDDAVFL